MKRIGKDLTKHRKIIDSLDKKIVSLLNDRARVAERIGKIKSKRGDSIFVQDREVEVLAKAIEASRGPLDEDALEDIFRTVLTACRSLQKRLIITYLGPEATFTHQAAIQHFGRNTDYVAVPSIKDVFHDVERGRADYGVVPIENSTEGVVNHTLDMFIDSDLVIVAERLGRIQQSLLSLSGEQKKIKTVFSHPQALAQCRDWLDAHLPGVAIVETHSTADAAVQATLDETNAAVASGLAAKMYHLKLAAEEIEDTADNTTRFLVIGKSVQPSTGKDKTSILFSIKDKVGALYEMLVPFRKNRINLTKIESRPTKKKAWEYIFFVDFIGHQSNPSVKRALAALQKQCKYLKVLGSYPYTAK